MIISTTKFNPFRSLLLWDLVFVFFGCSTAGHIERKESREEYGSLGLNKGRKDNVALYKEAASWMHVPHVDGGMSRKGTDCSFLVYSIYKAVYHKTLERNSAAMLKKNCRKIGRNSLKEGDLVFFDTSIRPQSKSYINHVGIYLKDKKFLHASTYKGVIVSDLDEDYYRKTWVSGGRVK
jgi:cell wall-associated NlpC family hydrolase